MDSICKKERFLNQDFAELYIKKYKKTYSKGKTESYYKAYLCPKCSNWHLTTKKPKESLEKDTLIEKYKLKIDNQKNQILILQKKLLELKKYEEVIKNLTLLNAL